MDIVDIPSSEASRGDGPVLEQQIPERPRRLSATPTPRPNSLWHWRRAVPFWRVARNFLIIYLARLVPWLGLKNALYRWAGMRVGRGVAVGLMAMFDVFFPELIEIGENSIVGYGATILAHEFLIDEYRTGRVIVGREVVIGANTTVLPGVTVGDRTVVSAGSLVNRDLPEGVLAGGVPARVIRAEPRSG